MRWYETAQDSAGYSYHCARAWELAVEGLHFPLQLLRLCTELKVEILVSLYDGNLLGGKKEARRCEPGFSAFDLTVLFSLDPLSSVRSFSFE